MKYIEAPNFGGPEVLRLIEAETPRQGEAMLLVEVQASGVNYADVMARSGFYPTITKAPFVLGFEVAGIVREVGTCVEDFKAGDSVAAITPAGGGYATHVVIPAATAIPVPNHLEPALATTLLMQGATAYIALDQAQVKNGDVVMITAAAPRSDRDHSGRGTGSRSERVGQHVPDGSLRDEHPEHHPESSAAAALVGRAGALA